MEKTPINFSQHSSQERFETIKSQIQDMKEHRVSLEDFEADLARDRVLTKKEAGRTLEENKEKDSLRTRFNEYGVFVKTISDFRYALECLDYYSKEKIDDLVSHENAHANKIETLGIDFVGYRIISYITKEGKEGEIFFAQRGEYPNDWSTEEELRAIKDIAQAPEEYESGEPLSNYDKKVINNKQDDKFV